MLLLTYVNKLGVIYVSIKYAILGLLSWKPSTGYELKKIFQDSSIMYWSGNNNQIYKALIHLQDEGFVTSETQHQESLPSKKIYTITDEGISELKEWLISSPEAPEFKKPFLVQLAWSDLLSNQELNELLTKYENETKMQLILHQEKKRRGINIPNRTAREILLWDMISENILSSYRNELEWVGKIRQELFENEIIEERMNMNHQINEIENQKYIELFSCADPLNTEQDALDLVALCGDYETNLLMVHASALSDDFFKLKTGIAGKILQKFINYHVKVSAIIPDDKVEKGKFKDMILEANRGNHFRVFQSKAEAEKWLLNE